MGTVYISDEARIKIEHEAVQSTNRLKRLVSFKEALDILLFGEQK